MIDHRRALTLAATAVDFPLDASDRGILDAHVRECAACRLELAAYHRDAARLVALAPIVPPARVRGAIGKAHRPTRFVLLAAAALLLTASAGLALVGSALRDARTPDVPPAVRAVPSAESTRTPVSSPPVVKTGPILAALGDAQMAPGPDGGLYVLIDAPRDLSLEPSGRVVLALLDGAGQPRPGWPLELTGWSCGDPNAGYRAVFTATDGSVRFICTEDVDGVTTPRRAAFAFDATGRAVPWWPVDLPAGDISWPPQVVGAELRVVAHDVTAISGNGARSGAWWVITVAADGTVRQGARYEVPDISPYVGARLGSDGAAYLLATGGTPNLPTTQIVVLDVGGVRAGWPLTVDGVVSYPTVGPQGRLYFTRTEGAGASTHSQTLVFEPDGRSVAIGSDALSVAAQPEWTGAGAWLAEPTVAADGTAFIVGEIDGRTVAYAIDPAGLPMPGWPYRLDAASQGQGTCSFQDRACGVWRPSVGLDGTVYLLVAAADDTQGGSMVAIGVDGQTRPGWPVRLPDAGARFLSAEVSSDGTVYALAVEPAAGRSSWTLYAIDPDGSVRARTPIVTPAADCVIPAPDIAALSHQVDPVACYGNGPLVLDAYLIVAQVDWVVSVEPAWLGSPSTDLMLVGETRKVGAPDLLVAVDPASGVSLGKFVDTNVRITGHYDDPAAQTCRETGRVTGMGTPEPAAATIERCRRTFVVTQVVPLQP